jgi:L-fucose isomerase-like protein
MKLGLLPVAAEGHDTHDDRLSNDISEMVDGLCAAGIETVVPQRYATDTPEARAILDELREPRIDAIAVYHLTGGTEQTVVESLAEVSRPVVLLGTSRENSFAAAVEARSALERAGHRVELVFAEDLDEATARELRSTVSATAIATTFEGFRLGLIGKQSPWLVSAIEDADRIRTRLGPRLVRVEMETVLDAIEAVPDQRAETVAEALDANAAERIEPDETDLVEAARIYRGLETIVAEHDLDAITVGCFELIPELGNTACYALAQLLDDGLVAGCEGDLQATLSMELLDRVTDDPVWMANTVAPDASAGEMTFAHCTIAPGMLADSPVLRSHFESGTGVAIQGELEARDVTLARIGGEAYDELFVAAGTVSEGSVDREDMCRTQVTIALDGDVDSYLDRTLGNHVAIGYGDVRDELAAVAEELGVELVEVEAKTPLSADEST